jgi:hypothetical protein
MKDKYSMEGIFIYYCYSFCFEISFQHLRSSDISIAVLSFYAHWQRPSTSSWIMIMWPRQQVWLMYRFCMGWELWGSNPSRGKVFHTSPGLSQHLALFLGWGAGVKQPWCSVDHPLQSSAEVKERVELYLYPSVPSWHLIRWTLLLLLLWFCAKCYIFPLYILWHSLWIVYI